VTLLQIIIILAGLFIGFQLVSHLLSPGTGKEDQRSPPESRQTANDEQEHSGPSAQHTATSSRPLSARSWYQTLDVRESASREEIDRAYRQQISQYHPDKVATLGEDIRHVAEARTKEINAAYDIAMRLGR
jgi:DnaJ-domain-containing protein 1